MDKTVFQRVQEHYNIVQDKGYEVVGVFLQGSQNYGLAYEGSDVDTKAIVLPKFEDIIFNNKPISTTLVLDNNEHIDLKDIRLMFDCFRKQNINFVEILFTPYNILKLEYAKMFQPLIYAREKIARYNIFQAINCMAGMALEKYKALEHPYPATIDKIEKYGYDPKQLHHIMRLHEFINRYINGEPYIDCLKSRTPNYHIGIKTNSFSIGLEQAGIMAKEYTDKIVAIKNNYMQSHICVIDEDCNHILNKVLYDILKHNFNKEFGGID